MINDSDFRNPGLFGSVIFRPAFNKFERINATQAWSLLFTGGQENKTLGVNPQTGRRLTVLLFAIAAAGIAAVLIAQTRLLG